MGLTDCIVVWAIEPQSGTGHVAARRLSRTSRTRVFTSFVVLLLMVLSGALVTEGAQAEATSCAAGPSVGAAGPIITPTPCADQTVVPTPPSPSVGTEGAEAAPLSCAAGPAVGAAGTTITGTPCADRIVVTSPFVRSVYGGEGNDVIYGGPNVELIDGGGGDDVIYGGPEASSEEPLDGTTPAPAAAGLVPSLKCEGVCEGGTGNQTIEGGPGSDTIFGQRGNDILVGNAGADRLYGGIGDDRSLRGGPGDDLLSGGPGEDDLFGEEGNDYVRGDASKDKLFGGMGTNTVSFATATTPGFEGKPFPLSIGGSLSIEGFPSENNGGRRGVYIRLDKKRTSCGALAACNNHARYAGGDDLVEGFKNVIGSPFADIIIGSSVRNRLYGGGGSDVIVGNGGEDELYGGAESDYLEGSSASILNGEAGADNCVTGKTKLSCEGTSASVTPAAANLVSVGLMAPNNSPFSEYADAYFVGGSGNDNVHAKYVFEAGKKSATIFNAEGSTEFKYTAESESEGCTYSAKEIVCNTPGGPDSLAMAAMGGESNSLSVANGKLALITSPVIFGGDGKDSLYGSGQSEDVLVDGPGNDNLYGYNYDDFLTNNAGLDHLYGGSGNDLILSTTTCGGDTLNGAEPTESDGSAVNDASWTKLPSVEGVTADLDTKTAGSYLSSGVPACKTGTKDSLASINDLEGSEHNDALYGNAGENLLIGNRGKDSLYGREGADKLNGIRGKEDFLNGGEGPGSEKETIDICRFAKHSKDTFAGCEKTLDPPFPEVETAGYSQIEAGPSARLYGTVNPEGVATEYTFEWGKAAEYVETGEFEATAPAPGGSAGSGTSFVAEEGTAEGLEPGVSYDYRIAASSSCDPEEVYEECTSYGEVKPLSIASVSAPANTAVPVASPATPDQAVPEAASSGSWTNSPTGYSYQWRRCNSTGGECADIAGATRSTYIPIEADVGHTLVVKVTASNCAGSNSASSKATNKVEPVGKITEYSLPSGTSPAGIITGSDGNLWFTREGTSHKFGKMTLSGAVTEYALPSNSRAKDIEAGPDGNLWMAEDEAFSIAKSTTSGSVTEYAQPSGSYPTEITTGPDGNLWFVDYATSKISKITTAGAVTEFALPSGSYPRDVTTGPDGNLWYTDYWSEKIGEMSTEGTIVAEFPLPKESRPFLITAGPDDNLWFTETVTNKIVKITPDGTLTEYLLPKGSGPFGILSGPDGNLWFTDIGSDKIGRITPAGAITEYALPAGSTPWKLTMGPDQNLWFTEINSNKIGKLTP